MKPLAPDPAEARAQFAAFPPALQAAMKSAGATERWTATFWADETRLADDLLARSGRDPDFAEVLAGFYRQIRAPVPPAAQRVAANAP